MVTVLPDEKHGQRREMEEGGGFGEERMMMRHNRPGLQHQVLYVRWYFEPIEISGQSIKYCTGKFWYSTAAERPMEG